MNPVTTLVDLPPVPPSATEQQRINSALRRLYGATTWYGCHTRSWWALHNNTLIEALTPGALEAVLIRRTEWPT